MLVNLVKSSAIPDNSKIIKKQAKINFKATTTDTYEKKQCFEEHLSLSKNENKIVGKINDKDVNIDINIIAKNGLLLNGSVGNNKINVKEEITNNNKFIKTYIKKHVGYYGNKKIFFEITDKPFSNKFNIEGRIDDKIINLTIPGSKISDYKEDPDILTLICSLNGFKITEKNRNIQKASLSDIMQTYYNELIQKAYFDEEDEDFF